MLEAVEELAAETGEDRRRPALAADCGESKPHKGKLDPADITLLDQVAVVSADGGPTQQATDAYRRDPRLPAPAPLADGGGPGQ